MKSISKLRRDEHGMASLLVTMIMIIVISLIVIGFTQAARRNQREALDDQLSAQASYAAESGVNAAEHYLTEPANIGVNIDTVGKCTSFIDMLNDSAGETPNSINTLDASTQTSYTCLMVNTQPSDLSISSLTQDSNQILYLANTDGEPFTQLKFSWGADANSPFSLSTCSGSGGNGDTLPSNSQWDCAYGVLRIDLVDADNVSNASLSTNQDTMSFYLIPSYNSGSPFVKTADISWPPVAQSAETSCSAAAHNCPVQIIPVSCSSDGCSLQLNITSGSVKYLARLSMMYLGTGSLSIAGGDASHTIDPTTGVGTDFMDGQAVIDSTGRSEDELHRVQVRIPINSWAGSLPIYGLQTTQGICKQIEDGPSLYLDSCPDGS